MAFLALATGSMDIPFTDKRERREVQIFGEKILRTLSLRYVVDNPCGTVK